MVEGHVTDKERRDEEGQNAGKTVLLLEALTAGYRGIPVVSNLDLVLERGRLLVLVGPNGAGKSTVIKTLARQLPAISGNVLFLGRPLESYAGAALARKMAVLFPEDRRPSEMTCFEMAAAGRYPYTGRFGRLTDEDEAVVEEALRYVGAWEYADGRVGELSDGQRQRVRIARVIAQQPELIVLDEPTAFLDIRYKLEILTVLRRLADERKTTIVMALHDTDLAARVADDALLVYADHLWRWGRVEEMMTEGNLRELYGMDAGNFDERFADYRMR